MKKAAFYIRQMTKNLGACRTWGVESENRPQRGQFLPDLQAHSPAIGQKDGEKWTAAVDLQPTIPKSDRLLYLLKPLLRLAGVAAVLAGVSVSAQAPLDVRVALIIGNSAYANSPLVNPANDARAMGEVLRSLGFQVIELRDGSKAQMSAAISKVSDALKGKQGVGML